MPRHVWLTTKLLLAFGSPILLCALTLLYERRGLSEQGSIQDVHTVGIISLALALIPLGLMLLGFVALVYVRRRSVGVTLLASCVVFTVAAFASTELRWETRIRAFEAFAERSATLVSAVDRYHQARGRPPEKLGWLVPEYLPRVPDTGLGAFPEYVYQPVVEGVDEPAWGLEVPISQSPPARLVYRSSGDYDDLEGARVEVGDWVFEFEEYERDAG